MPQETSPGKPTTRRYTDEEKAQAVRLVRQLRKELGTEHGTVQRVASQLDYGVETVRKWVRQADIDAHRDEFGVEPICTVMQLAPSTHYAAKQRETAPSARAVPRPRLPP